MIQIKTVLAGFPTKEATQLLVRPLINSTTDISCQVYWQLFTGDNIDCTQGNLPITEEEYILWDATNESLENIVLTKLNLERA